MRYSTNQLKTFCGTVSAIAALSFSTPVLAAPIADVVGGVTSARLSNELVKALGSLRIQPAAVGDSKLNNGVASFSITGGAIDLATVRAEIIHQGGLSLSTPKLTIEITDFTASTLGNRAVLTGLVTVNGNLLVRAPLFEVDLPEIKLPLKPTSRKTIDLRNIDLTLTPEAAGLLNQTFGVTAFTPGFKIATVRLTAVVD